MINKVEKINEIIPLWQQAFDDTNEDILYFANNVKDAECIGYYINNKLVSMLYLVSCKIDDCDAKYIYAACTLNEYKRNGYMSALIDYCKLRYNYICLIPAKEELISFYKNQGFDGMCDITQLRFKQIKTINNYLFEGCSLNKPILMTYRR